MSQRRIRRVFSSTTSAGASTGAGRGAPGGRRIAVPSAPSSSALPSRSISGQVDSSPSSGQEEIPAKPVWKPTHEKWPGPGTKRLGLALAGVALAGLGEALTEAERSSGAAAPSVETWCLFALGAALFAAAVWSPAVLRPAEPLAFREGLRAILDRRHFLELLAASLACATLSLPLFFTLNSAAADTAGTPSTPATLGWSANTGSWLLWLLALVLFCLAWVLWDLRVPARLADWRPRWQVDMLPARREWPVAGALFLLALVLRVPGLQTNPPGLWFDEAQNGIVGMQLLQPGALHPTYIGGFTQMGAIYFYLQGVIIRLVGPDVWALRILPAIAGSLTVPLLYLLASRLYGWRAGLAAAGLLAVSTWNITFSRFGIATMVTVALDMAVYLCAIFALRTGKQAYYAGAGVLLGLGLQGYYAARLVPLVLAAIGVHLVVTQRAAALRAVRTGLVVFLAGAAVAFIPVGTFAVQHWDAYNARVASASIFTPEGSEGKNDAIIESLTRHLLMFNYQGDANPRHDLAREPMLDPLTAALMFVGLGSCLLRSRKWQYAFPLVWFITSLSGGVFSLLYEAPQAHRTLENSVVTALLAGIVLGEIFMLVEKVAGPLIVQGGVARAWWKHVRLAVRAATGAGGQWSERVPARTARRVVHSQPATTVRWLPLTAFSLLGIGVVVGWLGMLSFDRYFNRQMNDLGVWSSMNAPQAEAARLVRQYGRSVDVYLPSEFRDLPTTGYLAPGVPSREWTSMPVPALPLDSSSGKDAIIAADDRYLGDLQAIAHIYPHALFKPLSAPSDAGKILLWTVYIPASDLAAVHGVRADRLLQASPSDPPGDTRVLPQLQVDSSGVPWKGPVRLSSTLQVRKYGAYTFQWVSIRPGAPTPSAAVNVDGFVARPGQPLLLAAGLHSLVVSGVNASEPSQLTWKNQESEDEEPVPASALYDPVKVEPHGLTAEFREGSAFEGEPRLALVDPTVAEFFHITPLPRPYTGEWKGKLYAPVAGTYVFSISQVGESSLYIDGKLLITDPKENEAVDYPEDLQAGWHTIEYRFLDKVDFSRTSLYWTPPGGTRSLIPSAFLWPVQAEYPDAQTSADLPTLAQADSAAVPPERLLSPGQALPVSGFTGELAVARATKAAGATGATGGASTPAAGTQPAPPRAVTLTQGSQGDPSPSAHNAAPVPEPLTPLATLGPPAGGPPLTRPQAAAGDEEGNIYVYWDGQSEIVKYDPAGKVLTSWAVRGASGSPLTEGSALTYLDGRLEVLDAATSDLLTYTTEGKSLGAKHLCDCDFPRSLTPANDGSYWVADTGFAQILKVGRNGEVVASVGGIGSGPGQFVDPAGVVEASDGSLFVLDNGNGRVQKFTSARAYTGEWSVGKSVARDGTRIAMDGAGQVLVAQLSGPQVVLYDASGRALRIWAYTQASGGSQSALSPGGLAYLGGDRFVVLFRDDNLGVVFGTGNTGK